MKVPRKDKAAIEREQIEQTRQRVRVGMIGLAAIVLLIGLASAIFSSVNRQEPVAVAGAAQPEVVANMSAPVAAPSAVVTNEPLAEMGVTPGAANTPAAPAPAPVMPEPAASSGTR